MNADVLRCGLPESEPSGKQDNSTAAALPSNFDDGGNWIPVSDMHGEIPYYAKDSVAVAVPAAMEAINITMTQMPVADRPPQGDTGASAETCTDDNLDPQFE